MIIISDIPPQMRNMEEIMHAIQGWGQHQSISHFPHSLQNLKRSYESGTQLSLTTKSGHSSCWRYLQEYLIFSLKLQQSSVQICPLFLPILSCLETIADDLNFVHYLNYNLWSQQSPITNDILT